MGSSGLGSPAPARWPRRECSPRARAPPAASRWRGRRWWRGRHDGAWAWRDLLVDSRAEVEVLGDARAVALEGFEVAGDALARHRQVLVVEVEVEQVDVPGRLAVARRVGGDDLARDRQRGVLG